MALVCGVRGSAEGVETVARGDRRITPMNENDCHTSTNDPDVLILKLTANSVAGFG